MAATRPKNQLRLDLFETPVALAPTTGGETDPEGTQGVEAALAQSQGEGQEPTDLRTCLHVMEWICRDANIEAAVKRVRSNRGAPGVDGMSTRQLPAFLKKHWPSIRRKLLDGKYQPQAVRLVEIDKPDGGVRQLGIPTVLDRTIQQAILEVLQPVWDPTFHESSYGFRPGRSAHQAIDRAQELVSQGYTIVVDIDLEKFFDRVNHDVLMDRVSRRIADKRLLKLIGSFLRAGMMDRGLATARIMGTPQGSPLSPLLSNLLLDELDRELDRRGHHFVRYADDCNIYVKSERSGQRVMNSVERFLSKYLRLKVNHAKSAVAPADQRDFLGFRLLKTRNGYKRMVSRTAVQRFRRKVRKLTKRHRGRSLPAMVKELNGFLRGWLGYFGHSEITKTMQELEGWIRRRLRAVRWKQWRTSRRRYRELKRLKATAKGAWELVKLGDRHWYVSKQPLIQRVLSLKYFDELGLMRIYST